MAFYTSTFSGWRLTGEDAEAFLKQVKENEGKHNPLAQAAYDRGHEMMKEFDEKGYCTIRLQPKKRKKIHTQ